jgi:hypothetical protein
MTTHAKSKKRTSSLGRRKASRNRAHMKRSKKQTQETPAIGGESLMEIRSDFPEKLGS